VVFEITKRDTPCEERYLDRSTCDVQALLPLISIYKTNDQGEKPCPESVPVEEKCRRDDDNGDQLDQERDIDRKHHRVVSGIRTLEMTKADVGETM
jgi:hypothetical protein